MAQSLHGYLHLPQWVMRMVVCLCVRVCVCVFRKSLSYTTVFLQCGGPD